MKVLFTHTTGLTITVETTNVLHIVPTITCSNEVVENSLRDNMQSFLASYVFRDEINGARELYGDLLTESDVSKSSYSVQVNLDRYLQDFLIRDMAVMGYSHEVLE